MVESAPEPIFVFDLDEGHFVEVNEAACRLYGLERDALLMAGPVAMSPPRQPDGRPSPKAAWSLIQAAMTAEETSFEWMHQNSGGELVPCRIHLARIPSPHAGRRLVRARVVDLRPLRASAREIERLRALIDATPDIVGIAEPDGRLRFINPTGRAALGLSETEDVGAYTTRDVHPPKAWAQLEREGIPTAVRDGIWRGESEMCSTSGQVIPVSMVLVGHVDDEGRFESISTIARDISDRRVAEELERRLLQAQKLDSLGALAGGVAHDFNNLLVGVLTNAELLRRRLDASSEERQLADSIREAGDRAAALAREMLAYAGRAQTERRALWLEDVGRDGLGLLRASIGARAVLELEFSPETPAIRGDPTQLQQVLMNLVLNAAEALPERGTIHVRTYAGRPDPATLRHDSLPRDLAGPCAVLEVEDDGCGIDAGALERVFEPFFSTRATGRGLGLSTVFGVMRAHEGAIAVRTAIGSGTRFSLYFPPAPEPVSLREPPPKDAPTRERAKGGLVLVIDDDVRVRQALWGVLVELGYNVVLASDGSSGLAVFRTHRDALCAAIVDLTMPAAPDGIAVAESMRAERPTLPIVITSGYSEASPQLSDHSAFLPKPFGPGDVARAIETASTD